MEAGQPPLRRCPPHTSSQPLRILAAVLVKLQHRVSEWSSRNCTALHKISIANKKKLAALSAPALTLRALRCRKQLPEDAAELPNYRYLEDILEQLDAAHDVEMRYEKLRLDWKHDDTSPLKLIN
ncbi:Protein of unknown function [Gryllus bimaculatus]|nr:Protein of unknown function [Gryllus bimaculatus]